MGRVYGLRRSRVMDQQALRAKRGRMRGAEDPPPPLRDVLHDGLGFQQVVACVEIKLGAGRDRCPGRDRCAQSWSREQMRYIVIGSQRSLSRGQQRVTRQCCRLVQ